MTMAAWLRASTLLAAATARAWAADPDTLWRIVNEQCVPHEEARHDPAPCALVDLSQGYAVLKDLVGATQFLVLPTARVAGIESPEILAPGASNYMADAWAARRFVTAKAPGLGRDDLALAINSVYGRSQNQLHIHVDCLDRAVRDALALERDAITDRWVLLPVPLAGRRYRARRLLSRALDGVNPFALLADSSLDAAAHMGDYTLVVAGETFADGPGFVLLADRADPAVGNPGSGEALQDHSCALAHP